MRVNDVEELMRQVAEVGQQLEKDVYTAQLNSKRCQEIYIALHKFRDSLILPEETTDAVADETEQTVDS